MIETLALGRSAAPARPRPGHTRSQARHSLSHQGERSSHWISAARHGLEIGVGVWFLQTFSLWTQSREPLEVAGVNDAIANRILCARGTHSINTPTLTGYCAPEAHSINTWQTSGNASCFKRIVALSHRAHLRDCWLLATRVWAESARAPCGWMSECMSAFCASMSLHILSKLEAEILWHRRSTCHVIGV